MISILIPIYNDVILELVKAIHTQCMDEAIDFEIICLDDGSSSDIRLQNAVLADLPLVQYLELTENIGRSRIRNRLADLAKFPYLLFMDGDSRVVRSNYIRRYLDILHPDRVIYGGRVYSNQSPLESTFRLHWRYGLQREALTVSARNAHPYRTFMTNNFVVPLAIFRQVRFDETIRRYGYEDTLYALALQQKGINIVHTDNPLLHLGLETRTVFLRKIGEALDNLREILPLHPEIDTRLLMLVRRLERSHLLPVFKMMSSIGKPIYYLMRVEACLCGCWICISYFIFLK
ncbi:MAG: glycosyltransferase [Saprospiraceae bacterium]